MPEYKANTDYLMKNGSFNEIMKHNRKGSWLERHAELSSFLTVSPLVQTLCLPSACSAQQLDSIVRDAILNMRVPFKTSLTCEQKMQDKQIDLSVKLAGFTLCLIGLISVIATIRVNSGYSASSINRAIYNPEPNRTQFVNMIRIIYFIVCLLMHIIIVCYGPTPVLYSKLICDN